MAIHGWLFNLYFLQLIAPEKALAASVVYYYKTGMILYPSIHLKDGVVARLTRAGADLREAEILHNNPAERAAAFEAENFSWLHVVDLNGAFEGHPANGLAISSILKAVKIPVQLGGGIRDMNTIAEWIDRGVSRILLTSAAIDDPDLLKTACKTYPGKIGVKIDARRGYVVSNGWAQTSTTKALDLALRVEEAGAAAIIYADINSEGALSEVNIEAIIDLAFALSTPVIASGGLQSIEEVKQLRAQAHAGIEGLILGRSLYNGKIDAKEALKIAA